MNHRRTRHSVKHLAIAFVAVTTAALLGGPPQSASAARKVTKKKVVASKSANYSIAIRNDAITAVPGGNADFDIVMTKTPGLDGGISWGVPDLPSSYTYSVTPVSTTSYRLRVNVPASEESSSTVYVLKAFRGSIERPSLFRIVVQAPPKATVATTTSVAPAQIDFALKADVQQRIVLIGDTAAFPITVDRKGYVGPIAFVAEGAPTGATVGYSPNPSNGNTTLYITPQATTPPGRSLVIVSAKIGSQVRSTAVEVITRKLGAFDASVVPSLVKTSPGNDARFTVSLAASSGLPYVNVALTGLPSGAVLRTIAVSSASTPLIISTSKTTPAGSYLLKVSLTSGGFSRQTTVTLVVDPQLLFSVTPDTSTITVKRGEATSLNATIARAEGFTETLTYQINGLPAGVGATFDWTPTGVAIKFTATQSAPTGSFPLEYVITGGGRSTTTTLALVVT